MTHHVPVQVLQSFKEIHQIESIAAVINASIDIFQPINVNCNHMNS